MVIPEQAAILCGGLGARLRPITDKIPKPMVLVNGVPFLRYLLEQLKENGIREVILMTGYLGEQIRDYFGDGSSVGLKVRYSHGPVEWETGRRLYEIRELLQDYFLLMYSDNFVPFNLGKLTQFYFEQKKLLSFIVQAKSSGNIRLADDGTVEAYDKTRSADRLEFVELGYMIAHKKIFEYYGEPNVSFSDIITKLTSDRQVAGMVIRDAYHSISDLDRLRRTAEYLRQKNILLIDRDGVINEKAPRGEYIDSWSKFSFIQENIEGMKELSGVGFSFVIISNQAGIGRGMMSAETVAAINARMRQHLEEEGIRILEIYVCPHHWEEKCFCRKPEPGLFFQASRDLLFRLDKTHFIGDDPRDCQAAFRAGCKCIYIGEEKDLKSLQPQEWPERVVRHFKEAVSYLVGS